MSKINTTADTISFYCPACEAEHSVTCPAYRCVGGENRATIAPSMVFYDGQLADGKQPGSTHETVCHCIVSDGRIIYMDESTHALSGKAVDLPEMP